MNSRKVFGEKVNSMGGDNWQNVSTPFPIVTKMIDMIDDYTDKVVMVIFNWEFVEVLINDKGVQPSDICFVCDTELEQKHAIKMYGVKTYLMTKEMVTNGKGAIDMTLVDKHLNNAKELLN